MTKIKGCDYCGKRVDRKELIRAGTHGLYCSTCYENRVGYSCYHKPRQVV